MSCESPKRPYIRKGVALAGYVFWIDKYAEHEAVLIDILIDAGPVPFVRTVVPTHAYGQTLRQTRN